MPLHFRLTITVLPILLLYVSTPKKMKLSITYTALFMTILATSTQATFLCFTSNNECSRECDSVNQECGNDGDCLPKTEDNDCLVCVTSPGVTPSECMADIDCDTG